MQTQIQTRTQTQVIHDRAPSRQRALRGASNHAAGLAAEARVEAIYGDMGLDLLDRRWRSPFGELDLIHQRGATLVFTEVKKSKTHGTARAAVSARQQERLMNAALAFLAATGRSLDVDMQFNVATCDAVGRIHILENAITA